MSTLLAVDPGVNACGVALFVGTELRAAALVENEHVRGSGLAGPQHAMHMAKAVGSWMHLRECPNLELLVIEVPIILSESAAGDAEGRYGKARPDDLIDLAGTAYAVAARLCAISTDHVRPFEWKKQEKKQITFGRVMKRLSVAEAACIQLPHASAKAHNVYDAIGIGLHALGRYHQKLIFR